MYREPGNPQNLSDLFSGQVVDIPEKQHFPEISVKPAKGLLQSHSQDQLVFSCLFFALMSGQRCLPAFARLTGQPSVLQRQEAR